MTQILLCSLFLWAIYFLVAQRTESERRKKDVKGKRVESKTLHSEPVGLHLLHGAAERARRKSKCPLAIINGQGSLPVLPWKWNLFCRPRFTHAEDHAQRGREKERTEVMHM